MEVDSSDDISKMETDDVEIPEPEIAKLWAQLFRVMDDVHEGTRLAAEGTAKALSKVRNFTNDKIVRCCFELLADELLSYRFALWLLPQTGNLRKLLLALYYL